MILLDIRTREEWADTGIAEGALPVSMHEPGFGASLQQIFAKFPDRRIGMICAVGGRTSHVISVLKQNGISTVIDVSEGMLGNTNGAGWIAKGLPLSSLTEAEALRDALLAE